jgi:predicted Zn-dependent peptidase
VISSVLTTGRTSRLYKRLVDGKIAQSVWSGDPGMVRYPDVFVLGASPLEGHTCAEIEAIVYDELDNLKALPVSTWELEKVRNQVQASFISQLNSNTGMAIRLASWEQMTGDWNHLVDNRNATLAVTADDIMRVAKKYFEKKRRTVATLIKPAETDEATKPQAAR